MDSHSWIRILDYWHGLAYTLASMWRPLNRMYLTAFLVDFACMVGTVVLPFFVYNQIGGGVAMSGVMGAVQAAAYVVVCLVSARYVMRTQNGLVWAVAGLIAYPLFFCLLPFFHHPVICSILATGSMGAMALVWPALHSWVGAEPDPNRRSHNMGLFNLSWSLGFAIGPLFAGPLYDFDFRMPFFLLFGAITIALFLVLSMPHERRCFGEATNETLEARRDHDRASESFLYLGWSASLMANLLTAATRFVFPARIDSLVRSGELRFWFESAPSELLSAAPATKYSWLAFLLSFVVCLCFLVMSRTSGWRHKASLLMGLQAAAGLSFVLLSTTHSLIVMAFCFAVLGFNHGVSFFAAAYYSLSDAVHKHRNAAMNEAAVGMGVFIGSLLFGCLAQRMGFSDAFRLAPLLVVVALIAEFGLLRHARARRLTHNG